MDIFKQMQQCFLDHGELAPTVWGERVDTTLFQTLSMPAYCSVLSQWPVYLNQDETRSLLKMWASPKWIYSSVNLSHVEIELRMKEIHPWVKEVLFQELFTVSKARRKKVLDSKQWVSIAVCCFESKPLRLIPLSKKEQAAAVLELAQFALYRNIHIPLHLWDAETQCQLIESMTTSRHIYGGFYPVDLPSSVENDIFCLIHKITPKNPSVHYAYLSVLVEPIKSISAKQVRTWIEATQKPCDTREIDIYILS